MQFPALAQAPRPFLEALVRESALTRAPAGVEVCGEGQSCTALAMVLEGQVRVAKLGGSGREITLYRIHPGDSCVLTTSCILSAQPFPAVAVTETEVEALFVPAAQVRAWLERYDAWRALIFGLVARRLGAVISLVEEVAFRRLDERLARLLLELAARHGSEVPVTHQRLADELGSSREVVSRTLKDLERQGLVAVARGRVRVQDPAGLERLAWGARVT